MINLGTLTVSMYWNSKSGGLGDKQISLRLHVLFKK